MGMVVRTNTMALNANRQLNNNSNAVAKSLEKLSSGYRINRAGDDASGLAISEKMKAQIKGLEQASNNSQDGISLIQTAEGAMNEVHNMLNRMVELATKSANGTIQDDVDRENIQNEVDALTQEINRIGNSTNFNGINLLDGSLSSKGSGAATLVGAPELGAPNNGISITDHDATKASVTMTTDLADFSANVVGNKVAFNLSYTDSKGNVKSATMDFTVKTAGTATVGAVLVAADGTEYTASAGVDAKGTDMAAAIADQLSKDKDFSNEFEIAVAGSKVGFTAKNGGKVPGISVLTQQLTSATGVVSAATAVGGIATTAGKDAYQSMGNVKYGDIFTLNGQKFAIFQTQAQATDHLNSLTDAEKEQFKGANFIYDGDTTTTGVVIGTTVIATNADTLTRVSAEVNKQLGYDGLQMDVGTANTGVLNFLSPTKAVEEKKNGPLTLQIGDTSADYNKMSVEVNDMRAEALGVGSVDVLSQASAGAQIDIIRTAINTVSKQRGDLGALQNRLEYTINNLDTTSENMTAANSRIRDTDMAKEMMNYTKMNVLVQSAQAMLAQANQQPQSILQLLQ